MKYTVEEICDITGATYRGKGETIVKHIAFDSRMIFSAKNTAFVAIKTPNNDGNKYIANAKDKGIEVIISSLEPKDKNTTWLTTENPIQCIQKLAKHHIQQFPALQTIGITGSNGKTIVKEWLYQTLQNEFSTVKNPKSFNSQLGMPLSVLEVNEHHEIGIFEYGISQPSEMKNLANILSPKIGILTNIGSAHALNFQSKQEQIEEKLSLFHQSETLIYNGDDETLTQEIAHRFSTQKCISFGLAPHNDITILNDWKNTAEHIRISIHGNIITLPVQHRDESTLYNALAVIAVLWELNFDTHTIIEKINQLRAVEMRLESIEGLRNNLIINDSYNLDYDSFKIALSFIQEYPKRKKVLVLSDFTEHLYSPETFYGNIAELTNSIDFEEILLVGNTISSYQHLFTAPSSCYGNTKALLENKKLSSFSDTLILLKGARKFEFEKILSVVQLQQHDTTMEINLHHLLHNIQVHRSLLRPETKIMAMVKAFSYGLGGYEVAEFLQHHHIDYLGVAYADEGVHLRKKGISLPIIVMNPEQHSDDAIIEYRLEPEIYSLRVLKRFQEKLLEKGIDQPYPIHLKLETGMHRLGFKESEIEQLFEELNPKLVRVRSIFSHLSSADVPSEKEYTLRQVNTFDSMSRHLIDKLGYTPIRHILNSAGIVHFPEHQYDMVRIGIGMMGISSHAGIQKKLLNAVRFSSVISQISTVEQGESVGYSRKHIAPKRQRIATIPVGYADGIPRLAGNGHGHLWYRNQRVPIVGNVCMDMLMIDVSSTQAKEGDRIIIFDSVATLEEFTTFCQTISYEVLTSISRRVKRIYIKE